MKPSRRLIPRRRRLGQRLVVSVLALLLGLGGPASQAQINLPSLGDSVSQDLDLGAERRIGDQVMRQIRPDPDYLDDPLLLEYVQDIWQPLVGSAKQLGNIAVAESRYGTRYLQ